MNENKKAPQNRIEVLEKIAKKLEWSRLYWRGPELPQIFVCPICTGVKPDQYDRIVAKEKNPLELPYIRGHYINCLYLQLMQ